MVISFHFKNTRKPVFFKPRKLRTWLHSLAGLENKDIEDLHYIFLSDDALLDINKNFLDHDTYTDIITFDHSEKANKLEGDIFISVDRVKANAKEFQTSYENELHRVMAHGLLHLCGYKDKNKEEEEVMRKKEDDSLAHLAAL